MKGFAAMICLFALVVAVAMPEAPGVDQGGAGEILVDAADAAPSSTASHANIYGAVAFERGPGGHFYTSAEVDGRGVRFLVDTGATGVVLTEASARQVGIALDPASYQIVGRQVSGEIRGQFVTLSSVRVGDKRVDNVAGVVVEGAQENLLGQSYLTRAGRIEMDGDTMTLR
ncbi:retropepsin-like aspartic protease family protein [Sphingomicrobium arenosum]|uniref:retropepsin-like aspartic protease family protein n=1 Tax=Sphingomicrobium arenosum TaxID=2233861 RepID=UPI002241025C|nr:TIGR02281 family clan AA aspartic protease [Sphingomicrobium arenosum]